MPFGICQLEGVQVVSHVGYIWIGPWANLPQYMDPTLRGERVSQFYCHTEKTQEKNVTWFLQISNNKNLTYHRIY